jgi:predicted glycoside hydrolase/deacetylase ChbG (UPF0249 family)
MAIRLIITADDCGLAQSIDHATGTLFQKGMVTTASIIMNYPHVEHAFDYLSRLPQLELGVHLNLTEGDPMSQNALTSDLVRASGRFRNRLYLFAQAVFLSEKMQQAIEAEFRTQIEYFITLSGRHPAHLTAHMHFHMFPSIRDIVYRLAEGYQVQWVRNSDFRSSVIPLHPMLDTKPRTDETAHHFFVPDYLVAVQAYLDFPAEQMLHDILKLNGTVEIVVHPSQPQDIHFPPDASYPPNERHRESQYLEKLFELMQPYLGNEIEIINTMGQSRVG